MIVERRLSALGDCWDNFYDTVLGYLGYDELSSMAKINNNLREYGVKVEWRDSGAYYVLIGGEKDIFDFVMRFS